jgi:hypothetical protein
MNKDQDKTASAIALNRSAPQHGLHNRKIAHDLRKAHQKPVA